MGKNRRGKPPKTVVPDPWTTQLADIATHLVSRNAEDVVVGLSVSELWLPNISAQAKHCLAHLVFGSIPPHRFRSDHRIADYADFEQFLTELYTKLPGFPTIEDYVPEMDWGEVKIFWHRLPRRMLYGSIVERLPDYIAAFELQRRGNPDAIGDMSICIGLQDHIIRHIDRAIIGAGADIDSGHLEIPSEPFWMECSRVLRTAVADSGIGRPPPRMVMRQGKLEQPKTVQAFADLLWTGLALPGTFMQVGDLVIPVSLRSMPSVIVDFWASDARATARTIDGGITENLAEFITQRVDNRSLITGPFRIRRRDTGALPHRFAAAISTDDRIFLVLPITEAHIPSLVDLERDIDQLVAEGVEWAFELQRSRKLAQFGNSERGVPSAHMISVVAVIAASATAVGHVKLPETRAHVLFLVDFITILDSVEDADELSRFFAYWEENGGLLFAMAGSVDVFSAFRYSAEVLIEGAMTPTMVMLDPHGGSNWRFDELSKFWKNAPPLFPDDSPAWEFEAPKNGVQTLRSKGKPALSSSTSLNECAVHFLMPSEMMKLSGTDGRILAQIVQCLPDALYQRRAAFAQHQIFTRGRIVTACFADPATVEGSEENLSAAPLFSDWTLESRSDDTSLYIRMRVNLARARAGLDDPVDARLEVECATEWLAGAAGLVDHPTEGITAEALAETGRGLPRFTAKLVKRIADVPEFVDPQVPQSTQYKLARRNLAQVFKDLGIEPGRYELSDAKLLIDQARDAYRSMIHARIAVLDRPTLVTSAIGEIDALVTEFQRAKFSIRQSLAHEVDFDRSEHLAEAHHKFTNESRNYRYLLECKLSMQDQGAESFTPAEMLDVVANIDWLLVLYGASDVLHHGFEVAGLELNDQYVPKMFYSENRKEKETAFGREMADSELHEMAGGAAAFHASKDKLDGAFTTDLGFSLTELLASIQVLAKWQTYRNETDFHLWYWASPEEIAETLVNSIIDLSADHAARIVEFAALQPDQIRRLLGKSEDEGDVPVWDHIKRGSRYTIRPLVPLEDGRRVWGAASAERCLSIWSGAISQGYLPADFLWPTVRLAIEELKSELDGQLEGDAGVVVAKFATYIVPSMDFRSRFPRERFEDVGDFDVLAYWPEQNLWLTIECKYNKPPFCLKDARRLRDEIFGRGTNKGQFAKIERRREFLTGKLDHLRTLLKWPAPTTDEAPRFIELYVCPTVFWSMRFPPYDIPTEFVRLGALEDWMASRWQLKVGHHPFKRDAQQLTDGNPSDAV